MISKRTYYQQPVLGVFSFNTDDDLRGNLEQLSVNPSSNTTTYDVTLTDDTGTIVYSRMGNTGTSVDDSKIGVYGKYTFNASNASSSNDTWTVTFLWDENLT
jgi:hypothetical protein